MAKALVTEGHLSNIAEAIRAKNHAATTYRPGDMAAAIQALDTSGIHPTGTKQITQNGTHDVTQYASANVNVSGGGGGGGDGFKGFELYAADNNGLARSHKGIMDNKYFVCYFDDNMQANYTLNGTTATFSVISQGAQQPGQLHATTQAIATNTDLSVNAIKSCGSNFSVVHYDSGSYISVIGGWFGYPNGGAIYENAANGTSNIISMNSAHNTLLIFIGAASRNLSGQNTIDINSTTYTVTNNGSGYDGVYGIYGAIVIENNLDTNITVTFPASCANYVSIIGID